MISFATTSISWLRVLARQNRTLEKFRRAPIWAHITFSNLIISVFTSTSHEPDRLAGEFSHIDPYLYSSYIHNYQDMTDRFGDGWYYSTRISGIFPKSIFRYVFGEQLGSHLMIFFGLTMLSISLIMICRKLDVDATKLFHINLIMTLSPLLLYEYGQDYPSVWSNIWGILGLGLLIKSKYLSFLGAGFFFSLAINAWESYIYLVFILVISYYLSVSTRIKLRTKINSLFLIICGTILGQVFLSLCMYFSRGMDSQNIFFQKITWIWIVSFFNLETTYYDVTWNLLGTKTIVIVLLLLPFIVIANGILEKNQEARFKLLFISKFSVISSLLLLLHVVYQITLNANKSSAGVYNLAPFIFTGFFISLLLIDSKIPRSSIKNIALVFVLINVVNLNPLLELSIIGGYFSLRYLRSAYMIRKHLGNKIVGIKLMSILPILLLGVAPTLDVRNVSNNFSTCILKVNCSVSDSKAKVANKFQDWYISKYSNNEMFYFYTIPDTNLEEDLQFRVLATGVFSFSFLPNLEGLEFEKINYADFQKYLSGKKNVVLISGSIRDIEEFRSGFLRRDSRFKVSPVEEIRDRDVRIYVSRIGV